jgi:HPt (histidine-containing phosphotransfer) domain-containing protein
VVNPLPACLAFFHKPNEPTELDEIREMTARINEADSSGSLFAPLDPEAFTALRDVFDEQTLADTYREFLSQTRSRLIQIPPAPDSAFLSTFGQTLRGSASMFGAMAIALLATELEHSPRTPADSAAFVVQLSHACNQLESALRANKVAL